RIRHADQRRGARLQRDLPALDLFEPLLELLLVEQLPAGDAIDLRAQLGDAILIGELLFGLARDQAGEHVVVEGEIASGRQRPAGPRSPRPAHLSVDFSPAWLIFPKWNLENASHPKPTVHGGWFWGAVACRRRAGLCARAPNRGTPSRSRDGDPATGRSLDGAF